jgi:hypothetical protein
MNWPVVGHMLAHRHPPCLICRTAYHHFGRHAWPWYVSIAFVTVCLLAH